MSLPLNTRKFLLRWAFVFVVVFPLSFPFEHGGILPDIGAYTQGFFGALARFTGNVFLGEGNYAAQLASDTAGFYLNALNVLVIAALLALVWTRWFSSTSSEQQWQYRLTTFVRYYLAWQMFWYGFDKVFKTQFYLPEPNTLFTPLGYLHKDILYWSTMGSSYAYTVFAGITEVLAAVLLVFHRTSVLGVLFTAAIMINVFMINIGFDISVKLYSCFLLLLCSIVIAFHAKGLYRFFIRHENVSIRTWRPLLNKRYYPLKVLVVLLILTDALAPWVRTGNFNDDKHPRPFLHGAYRVTSFELNGKDVPPGWNNALRWKRFFIHRRGYFIVQYMNDEMADLELQYDLPGKKLLVRDHDSSAWYFNYTQEANGLLLKGINRNDTIIARGEQLDLHELPLLKPEFGWTIGE